MGRRSTHTAEELRELILTAAREIIDKEGLSGLSARTIARRIGYSPGTLYNVFVNLDDLILHVEARLLDELDQHLRQSSVLLGSSSDPKQRLLALAQAYMRFTQERPRLWNLLFEHHLPPGAEVPAWYRAKLDLLLRHIEGALAPSLANPTEAALQRAARVLWAGVHGITSLATADKLSSISLDAATVMIDDLVTNYVNGLIDCNTSI